MQLVAELNDLMNGLYLPISIISPTDLTPSLLMAILESLLGEKIPLPGLSSRGKTNPTDLKVQKVKIFLGVLETDVLQQDVGLSEIDPRKLARGEWEETVSVAEVLVWIGKRVGLLPRPSSSTETHQRTKSAGRKKTTPQAPVDEDNTITSTSSSSTKRSRSSRFSSPELDTESVFYAPSSVSTRETQVTLSAFINREVDLESITTLYGEPQEHDSGPKSGDEPIPTPSSMALSLQPPFQSPRSSLRRSHQRRRPSPPRGCTHDEFPASLLLSNDHDESDDDIYASPKHSPLRNSPSPEPDANYPEPVPVRYTGFIEPVDEEFEIASYEHNRSFSSSMNRSSDRSILGNLSGLSISTDEVSHGFHLQSFDDLDGEGYQDTKAQALVAIEEEYQRTLKLLDERARLLKELAELDRNG
ncbi:hypothetical protein CC2G_010015 [Coprinopsis cinerea AmutBmut pab1-1]|nr:hypothetical protein CC2G_010015 [Coprinopsis cinerea AmutBmut pab1-1]